MSRKTIKKSATPHTSNGSLFAINIYKNDTFVVSYLYEGWTKDAVDIEYNMLRNRFAEYRGYSVIIG